MIVGGLIITENDAIHCCFMWRSSEFIAKSS